jgi:hypothetical protein
MEYREKITRDVKNFKLITLKMQLRRRFKEVLWGKNEKSMHIEKNSFEKYV